MEVNFKTKIIKLNNLPLENGTTLASPEACYTLYGDLTNGKKNALFFHGFSCSSELHRWWKKLPLTKLLDNYNILCINSLGSSHGSCGPLSINPKTQKPYLLTFPQISIQDTGNFLISVLNNLGIDYLDIVWGCSMGGLQVLDLFLRYPALSKQFISACGAPPSKFSKLYNTAQCQLIEDAFNRNLSNNEIEIRTNMARFFFKLSCASEESLEETHSNLDSGQSFEALEQHFIDESKKDNSYFSPYCYVLYKRMVNNFDIHLALKSLSNLNNQTRILLLSLEGDKICTQAQIDNLEKLLNSHHLNVSKQSFNTRHGHEGWILDGDKLFEDIKKYFDIDTN